MKNINSLLAMELTLVGTTKTNGIQRHKKSDRHTKLFARVIVSIDVDNPYSVSKVFLLPATPVIQSVPTKPD